MPNRQNAASAPNPLMGSKLRFDSPTLMQDMERTLSNLDFEHHDEMQRLERSQTDPALKRTIADSLRRKHAERREPYVKLLAELQKQAASGSLDGLRAAN